MYNSHTLNLYLFNSLTSSTRDPVDPPNPKKAKKSTDPVDPPSPKTVDSEPQAGPSNQIIRFDGNHPPARKESERYIGLTFGSGLGESQLYVDRQQAKRFGSWAGGVSVETIKTVVGLSKSARGLYVDVKFKEVPGPIYKVEHHRFREFRRSRYKFCKWFEGSPQGRAVLDNERTRDFVLAHLILARPSWNKRNPKRILISDKVTLQDVSHEPKRLQQALHPNFVRK